MIGSSPHAARSLRLAILCLAFSACRSGAQAPPLPPGFDGFLGTDRFAVAWKTSEGSAEDVQTFLNAADVYFDRIARLVGPAYTPQDPILIALGGSGVPPGGSPRFPNVDREGRIMLYQYTGDFADHLVEFPHELVHAFRRKSGIWHSGFWEEGFAEAISMEVYPDDQGFPRYGFPLEVLAGHLFARQEYIPLQTVRADHDGVGRSCQVQAYLERASFFRFLVARRGIDLLIELAYADREPTDAEYERAYGLPFADLVREWEDVTRAGYASIADADDLARQYRALPAVRSRNFCPGSP